MSIPISISMSIPISISMSIPIPISDVNFSVKIRACGCIKLFVAILKHLAAQPSQLYSALQVIQISFYNYKFFFLIAFNSNLHISKCFLVSYKVFSD
jgi:hypothetical protein